MPTRGTPHTPLRLSDEMLARIDSAVSSANKGRKKERYNRSSWIRHAIEEKLAKIERSRESDRKRKGQTDQAEQLGE